MNRSVKSLLSVSVLAPAAALAVAAAPAKAAPGPSTTLLYETYAAASPVGRTLPKPATATTGKTAERATVAVDGVLRPRRKGADARAARCKAKAGDSGAVTLPKAAGQTPLGALSKGDCLRSLPGTDRRLPAKVPPARPRTGGVLPAADGVGNLPGTLLGGLGNGAPALGNGKLSGLTGAGSVLPGGRRTQAPVSMALTDVPSTLGQSNGVVGKTGGLGKTGSGVGKAVKVLKAQDRVGGSVNGPVSLLNQSVPGGVGGRPPTETQSVPGGVGGRPPTETQSVPGGVGGRPPTETLSGLGVPGAPGLG